MDEEIVNIIVILITKIKKYREFKNLKCSFRLT